MSIDFSPDEKFNGSSFIINEEAMENFRVDLTKALVVSIKEQVIGNVIPSLGPKNFEGEAITYMKLKKIPISDNGFPGIPNVRDPILGVKQYSAMIYKEFINNVDGMIIYNEADNVIELSPYIEAFEFGDYYKPVLKTITRAIEQSFDSLG